MFEELGYKKGFFPDTPTYTDEYRSLMFTEVGVVIVGKFDSIVSLTTEELEAIKRDNFKLCKRIWECACGQGHLSKILIDKGYIVKSTDLIDRGYGEGGIDFLKQREGWHGDILTNPPYKYAEDFVEKALKLLEQGNHCVMFLKVQFLEGQSRRELFEHCPPKYVYVHSKRANCAKNGNFEKYGSNAICYCWYIWEKGFKGESIIRWI